MTGKATLSEIGHFCFGRPSIFVVNSFVAIGQLGLPIIYFIVFGDVAGGLIRRVNNTGVAFFESRWCTHTLLAV